MNRLLSFGWSAGPTARRQLINAPAAPFTGTGDALSRAARQGSYFIADISFVEINGGASPRHETLYHAPQAQWKW